MRGGRVASCVRKGAKKLVTGAVQLHTSSGQPCKPSTTPRPFRGF